MLKKFKEDIQNRGRIYFLVEKISKDRTDILEWFIFLNLKLRIHWIWGLIANQYSRRKVNAHENRSMEIIQIEAHKEKYFKNLKMACKKYVGQYSICVTGVLKEEKLFKKLNNLLFKMLSELM